MSEQIIKNNVAELIGVVKTGFTFSHEIYGESFYSFVMEVARLSNSSDQIPMLFICKKPMYRTTPLGREITDLLIAVNRPYNKSDYIPAIAWGRNAKFAETLQIGQNIKIYGRIQSRTYQKKISENETDLKTAYEVSISKMEVERIQEAAGE